MADNELHNEECFLCSSHAHRLGAIDKEQGQRINHEFVDGTILDCKTAKRFLKTNRQTWQIADAQSV